MEPISIILSSNRGSYESNEDILPEFDQLKLNVSHANIFSSKEQLDLEDLNRFIEQHSKHYLLGFIGYDIGFQLLKKGLSTHQPYTSLPLVWMAAVDKESIQKTNQSLSKNEPQETRPILLKQQVSKEAYIKNVQALKHHIQMGDIYEVNYCIPFVAENIEIDPLVIWERLEKISPMPFAAFIDHPHFSIISASPERFIKKQNEHLLIQPMKGTKTRGKDKTEDEIFKEELKNDPKEKAENVMIVDLTRNDLSKLAKKGTVKVDELFGIYSFRSVHQMVSTVSCSIDEDVKFTDIIAATFPMGSMTGAPKKKAVELIDQYEIFSRGPFSGMLGYIAPGGDFDFNVMIRTIFYDKVEKKIFMAVGSAITSLSDVEKEYEECLIKLQPLLQALNATIV